MDATDCLKLGVRLAGGLCAVPGVSALADVIVVLIETCEDIPKQRQNVLDLEKRCVSLLELLDVEASNGLPPSKILEHAISTASDVIYGVDKRMKRWAKKSKWKMFLRTGSIDDDVASSTTNINHVLEMLQLRFRSQSPRATNEMVEHMQNFIVTANQQGSHFPQNVEEGYSVMKQMQQGYPTTDPSNRDEKDQFSSLQESILKLQKEYGIVLPDPNLMGNEIKVTSQHPVGARGTYDIYPGTYLGKEVWYKKLSYDNFQGKEMMRFRREIEIWSKLWEKDQEQRRLEGAPPRILPLYGFYVPHEGVAYLVNAKPDHGTLREVLRSGAQLDPIKIIKSIAQALLLAHTMEPPIFHGDLNSTSIVIDQGWNPLLQGFGLSETTFDVSGPTAVTHVIEKHTSGGIEPFRWMAPEIFNPRVVSTRSDIWSFGMVIYEVLTRSDPFHEFPMFTVIAKIASGEAPTRPPTITNDKIWDLMKECWTLKPVERPSIQRVIANLDDL